MKYLIAIGLFLTISAHADIKGAPYQPEIDARFDVLEDQVLSTSDASDGSAMAQKYVRATYDVSVDGASSTAAIGLGVYLPAKAIVTKILYYIDSQFTDSGNGSIYLQCEDSYNLLYPLDITSFSAGAVKYALPAQSTTTPAVVDSIAAQCEVKAGSYGGSNFQGAVPSAGKLTAFIEYFIKN